MTMNLWWMCTAGGPRFFCPDFGGGSVLSLLRSTELSSGRNSAGVAPGRKNEYANTFLSLRERVNSVTLICVAARGWRGAFRVGAIGLLGGRVRDAVEQSVEKLLAIARRQQRRDQLRVGGIEHAENHRALRALDGRDHGVDRDPLVLRLR